MAWFVATLMLRHPAAVAEGAADDAGDAPAIEDARGDAAAAA